MAFSLNKAQIIGNVTRAPEVRMAGTQKVATFGVATNFSWMDKASGQRKEKVEFHNVVVWGRLAEVCEQYLRKGSKVYIEGRMQTRDWEGEDGVKRYKTEIVAENMIMLGGRGDAGAGAGAAGMGEGAAAGAGAGAGAGSEMPIEEGTSFQSPRAQRSVKKSSSSDMAEKAPKEEEVSIDDLPF